MREGLIHTLQAGGALQAQSLRLLGRHRLCT